MISLRKDYFSKESRMVRTNTTLIRTSWVIIVSNRSWVCSNLGKIKIPLNSAKITKKVK